VNVKQVSEELGVRYVLEGSVRRSGEKVTDDIAEVREFLIGTCPANPALQSGVKGHNINEATLPRSPAL